MRSVEKANGADRGYIVPIGGAERKVRNPEILRRYVELCGGREAYIAVIPTASTQSDTGDTYEALFRGLGVRKVVVLPFESRADCERAEYLEIIAEADGIFMTGGNQLRLSTTIGGTPAAHAICEHNSHGLHVAGTSAGAAFMSEHMIAGGKSGATPRADLVQLAPGLGLSNQFIVDQHFRQRDRLGRLLTALAYNPRAAGVGLDEDTAAFIGPDDTLEVVGSGGITIVDPSDLAYSTMDSAAKRDPVSLIGIRLHILVEGGVYNFATREARLG